MASEIFQAVEGWSRQKNLVQKLLPKIPAIMPNTKEVTQTIAINGVFESEVNDAYDVLEKTAKPTPAPTTTPNAN